jgi:hypothetical protein
MIPINALLPIFKVAAIPLLTALVVGSCTASHYRTKLEAQRLGWQAEVEKAKADAAQRAADQQRVTQEVTDGYQKRLDALDARYADAARRLRDASARRLPTLPAAAGRPDAAAGGDRLPDSSGDACLPAEGLAGLLLEADRNTQALIALQGWVGKQLELSNTR